LGCQAGALRGTVFEADFVDHVGEVAVDYSGGDKEGLGDLVVGESHCAQLRDSAFAGGERFGPAGHHPAWSGPGGAQLGLGSTVPRLGAEVDVPSDSESATVLVCADLTRG
jgi:hypothetical protein